MKKQRNPNEESTKKESREKKNDERTHNQCKWYDWSVERDFYRKVGSRNEKGERTQILERCGICRCEKAKAFRRLVMGDKVIRVLNGEKENTLLLKEKRRRVLRSIAELQKTV